RRWRAARRSASVPGPRPAKATSSSMSRRTSINLESSPRGGDGNWHTSSAQNGWFVGSTPTRRTRARAALADAQLLARHLDLDVPLLAEAAQREDDERELHRDDEQRQHPEQAGGERRVVEAVLVALEPRRRGDGGDDGEQHRERRRDRQQAARPARADEERGDDVDEDVGDRADLRALHLRPAADEHDRDEGGAHEQEEDDDRLRRLRLRLLAVGMGD